MSPRVLLVDNFDSFTHNLAQALSVLGADVRVQRCDAAEVAPDTTHVVISPGPGRPEAAGRTMEIVQACALRLPVLGICLGHQAIALAFGGRLALAPAPVHGKVSRVSHDGRGVFAGLPDPLQAARYHSLVVSELPAGLEACAWASDGALMGLRHRSLPTHGVQFHPESYMTPEGGRVLGNFLAEGSLSG